MVAVARGAHAPSAMANAAAATTVRTCEPVRAIPPRRRTNNVVRPGNLYREERTRSEQADVGSQAAPRLGAVHVFARGEGRASYDWRYSTDAQHCLFGPRTLRADVRLDGLVWAALYSFQYRAVTKEGVSDWSQVVSMCVA